ncbi:hypothetical protein PPERSA_04676 [Pseudocohnilembus persalinus]|uniref:Uncharacterized protein n=1 Tax=Pseudocohnilembus persalinus TaxID=266149 RepID=A0A0V0R4P6_PSEPJ|nr:hypothetical protein PPERSA_04676 [Pseudocohnilembus persalinus]|eukprot:KRX09370.1 hypothetical protein PPERSA_04676 [Pseudocohnilembus persalinus]
MENLQDQQQQNDQHLQNEVKNDGHRQAINQKADEEKQLVIELCEKIKENQKNQQEKEQFYKNPFLKKESKIFNYFTKADEKKINKKEENDETTEQYSQPRKQIKTE